MSISKAGGHCHRLRLHGEIMGAFIKLAIISVLLVLLCSCAALKPTEHIVDLPEQVKADPGVQTWFNMGDMLIGWAAWEILTLPPWERLWEDYNEDEDWCYDPMED